MVSRASTHLLILLVIIGLTAFGHYSIYYAALIRGYETSWYTAGRNLLLFVPLIAIILYMARFTRFAGNWTLFTTAMLLFSLGLVGQYRLFSDPEYVLKNGKAEARQQKIETLQMRYIRENYSAEKKALMGLPPTPPAPVNLDEETPRPANEGLLDVVTSGRTLIPLLAFGLFLGAYLLCRRDATLDVLQRNGFVIVLLTLVPLMAAAVTSSAGKSIGNMTPWEPSKVPFLVGFAAILTVLYRNLAKTYWGVPRASDVVPLLFMGALPFVPFFVLKDFGQMLVFSAAYITLYLVAVRRLPQRLVLIGSVVLLVSILVVGALPEKTQAKVPLLPTLAQPVKAFLPDRIQQRFHLWLDGFNPPEPDTYWWKEDFQESYDAQIKANPALQQMVDEDENMIRSINVDAWFDQLAFQPAQSTFGLSSGGVTGRGLGLGYPELIPVADSDYIYAALGEELGLLGGLLITLALIVFVNAGLTTAIHARDMFSKLCAAGLTAFIGFQALVNIGGITRALPMTGITLPFVSHGGFSLITSFAMLGMLMAFSHRNAMDAEQVVAPPQD